MIVNQGENLQRVISYHAREAKDEYHRKLGDDAVYDYITWNNIEPYLPKQGLVLDAGGGAGYLSIETAKRTKCSVVLLDITKELLKTAKRRVKNSQLARRIELVDADIRAVPFCEESFDFVLCEADPLCICGDPEKAVSELSRVLKSKGHFVAGVDSTLYRVFRAISRGESLDHVLEFLEIGKSPAEEGAPFESKSFTPTELIDLLKRHDLKTIRLVGKPIGFGPHIEDVLVRLLPEKERREIFKDQAKMEKVSELLQRIYAEPYVAGIGSHLHAIAAKTKRTPHSRT